VHITIREDDRLQMGLRRRWRRAVMESQELAQQIVDRFEQITIQRYESGRPVRVSESLEALVAEAARAAESRMRLEFALFRLSRSGAGR
jgi:hypothetical protein